MPSYTPPNEFASSDASQNTTIAAIRAATNPLAKSTGVMLEEDSLKVLNHVTFDNTPNCTVAQALQEFTDVVALGAVRSQYLDTPYDLWALPPCFSLGPPTSGPVNVSLLLAAWQAPNADIPKVLQVTYGWTDAQLALWTKEMAAYQAANPPQPVAPTPVGGIANLNPTPAQVAAASPDIYDPFAGKVAAAQMRHQAMVNPAGTLTPEERIAALEARVMALEANAPPPNPPTVGAVA